MRHLLLIITIITTFFHAPSGLAETQRSIKFVVKEKGTGMPLSKAEIRVDNQRLFTDPNGVVSVKVNASAKSKLKISRRGYQPESIELAKLSNESTIEVYLYPEGFDDADVLVQGKKNKGSSEKSISGDEARRIAPGGDAAKIIELMPGVQMAGKSGRGIGGPRGGPGGGPPPGGRRGPGGGPGGGRGPGGPPPGGFPGGGPPGGGPPPGGFPGGAPPGGGGIGPGPGGGAAAASGASSNAGIIIRGSAPADSYYLIDDIEVPYVFHTTGDLSILPGVLLQDVTFESGGFGVRYGQAMGGVVGLNTKSDIPAKSSTEFTLNIPYYSGAVYRKPIGEDNVLAVAYRRSYADYFLKDWLNRQESMGGSSNSVSTPTFSDAQLSYTSKRTGGYQKITLLFAEDGAKTVSSNRFSPSGSSSSFNSSSNDQFVTLGVEEFFQLSSSVSIRTTPQAYREMVDNKTSVSHSSTETIKGGIPTELTIRRSETENISVGANLQRTGVTSKDEVSGNPFSTSNTSATTTETKYTRNEAAGWTSIDQQLGPMKITPGIRYTYNQQMKKSELDPRLQTVTAVGSFNQIKASAGQYSKSPTPAQTSKEYGRTDLLFQRTNQYVLGLQTDWNRDWTTEVQVFLKRGYRLVESDPINVYNNSGSLQSKGLEFFVRKNLTSRFFGWLSYTYSKTELRSNDEDEFTRSPYDQTHVLNLVGDYRLTNTWDLGSRYKYNTGNTYTPSSGGVYNSRSDTYTQNSDSSLTNSKNIPAYQSVTTYVTKDILFNTWKLVAKAGVESYWNRPQVTSYDSTYDYSDDVPVRTLQNVPFLEIRGEL